MRSFVLAGLGAAAAATALAFMAWRTAQPTLPPRSGPLLSTAAAAAGKPLLVPLDLPRPLPPLSFDNGAGQAMALADFHGRIVLLNVWATWCAPCRSEMPALDRLQAKLGGSDFAVVPLSIDQRGRDAVERFYRELGLKSLGIYTDRSGNAAFAINAIGMPTTLLVDREGRELGRVTGAAEWDSAEMLSRIKFYLGTRDRQIRADAAPADGMEREHEPAR
jgi:thiol-disulfide isomerase/thioredoxin